MDGTSQEFLAGLARVDGGREALLAFFNQVYRDAVVPSHWNTALMVVIPKELQPVDPKNLRPLAMGSSVCQVLLQDASPEDHPLPPAHRCLAMLRGRATNLRVCVHGG